MVDERCRVDMQEDPIRTLIRSSNLTRAGLVTMRKVGIMPHRPVSAAASGLTGLYFLSHSIASSSSLDGLDKACWDVRCS